MLKRHERERMPNDNRPVSLHKDSALFARFMFIGAGSIGAIGGFFAVSSHNRRFGAENATLDEVCRVLCGSVVNIQAERLFSSVTAYYNQAVRADCTL